MKYHIEFISGNYFIIASEEIRYLNVGDQIVDGDLTYTIKYKKIDLDKEILKIYVS